MSVNQLMIFLRQLGRTKDMDKLRPYLFLARLEEKYPWLYSDTVLLSKAMGNIFNDAMVPYDILGLTGIAIFLFMKDQRASWDITHFSVFGYWAGQDWRPRA